MNSLTSGEFWRKVIFSLLMNENTFLLPIHKSFLAAFLYVSNLQQPLVVVSATQNVSGNCWCICVHTCV